MDNPEKKKMGRGEFYLQEIKASIRQSLNADISSLSLDQRKKLAANILQLDLKERKEDEINILRQLTEHLDFFTKINSKKINQETKLQEKICRRMKYECFSKGQTVIEYGAKADKFFIILGGSVSIFLIKSPEAIELEEHQLKTGRKLNAYGGGILNLNEDEELSQKDELNSPLSSVASSNNNRRDSQMSANSPFSSSVRRQSARMQSIMISRDSPKMIGQSEDKNNSQSNPDQLGNDDSPLQLEKILEKSKFSNYNPPITKERLINPSFRIKLNFDEKIQELAYEEDYINTVDAKNQEDGSMKIEDFYQSRSQSIAQQAINDENNKQRQSSLLQKRSINPLILDVHEKNPHVHLNKLRSASDISLLHQSHSSPLSAQQSRTISKMTMLQQAIKNNAEGGSIFKKNIKSESIAEIRQKLNMMSNSNNQQSPSSSSHSQSNTGSPTKLPSSSSKMVNKVDVFTFLEEEKNQASKNQNQRNCGKKTRLGKLIEFYKSYDLFGDLQLGDIENAEKYFTDSGIFKYEYRDKLKAGSTFGELGILEGKPRSALIICSEDAEFAIMEKDDYSELLAERDRKNLLKKFEFLKQKMFPELTNDGIKKIFYSFKKRFIQKNEVLFSEGDKANGVFIIKHGEISLSQKQQVTQLPNQRDILASDSQLSVSTDSPVLQKKKSLLYKPTKYISKIFTVISSGEYFGEEDLMIKNNQSTRHYTATCSSLEGSVYFIEANVFMKFIKQKPTSLLVIQKRLDKKLQWRNEHKEKWTEQAKKFSTIDSATQIEEAKMKQIIMRKQMPKRSSMIELQSPSIQLDTSNSQVSPQRRTTVINLKQKSTTSFSNISANLDGSLSQIPISTGREYNTQARLSVHIASTINMDKIWEEKSNDGSPRNSHLNSEKRISENILSSQYDRTQNPSLKMKTEAAYRSKDQNLSRQQRKSEITLSPLRGKPSRLQHLSSSTLDYLSSPINVIKQYSHEQKVLQSAEEQDIELLKKLSSLSKNNWLSAKKLRQTYSNYENISMDQKNRSVLYSQTPTNSKNCIPLSSQNSMTKVTSIQNVLLEQLQSPTFQSTQTLVKKISIQTSNPTSPNKKNIINFQQKLQGFSSAVQSGSNNTINQYSSCFDSSKEIKKLPQISSPQYVRQKSALKITSTQESTQQVNQKFKEELKKSDLVKTTQFYDYKQFLLKKEMLQESLNIQEEQNKNNNNNNGVNIDLFKLKTLSKRSTSQTDSPQRKVISNNKKDSMVRILMRKVKDKTDQIDSILRTDEFQGQYQSIIEQITKQKEYTKQSQERQSNSEIADSSLKKQSLNSLVSLCGQTTQDKSSILTIQDELISPQQNNRFSQQEPSPEKKQLNISLISNKNTQSVKSLNASKMDLYIKLKQNLIQNHQKNLNKQQNMYQDKDIDSPNNFIVSNFSKLKILQPLERD